MTHGYTENKDALIKRLHRIEGQVRGVERMVEDDRCSRRCTGSRGLAEPARV